MHVKLAATLATAMMLATAGQGAFAAPNEAIAEGAALDTISITIDQAIAAVEAQKTGAVVEAALLTEGSASVYHITTLMADGTETNYAVDAKTGAVVATIDMTGDDEQNGSDGETQDEGSDGDGEQQDDAAN